MPLVRTALRQRINNAAKRSSVLSLEAARLDLNFLDEILFEVRANTTVLNVGVVDAVDHVDVLGV